MLVEFVSGQKRDGCLFAELSGYSHDGKAMSWMLPEMGWLKINADTGLFAHNKKFGLRMMVDDYENRAPFAVAHPKSGSILPVC